VLQVGAGHIVLRGGGGVSGVLRFFARTFDPAVPPFSLNTTPAPCRNCPAVSRSSRRTVWAGRSRA